VTRSDGYPQKLQWDGKHMSLNAGGTIYQMQVSGSRGKIVGTTGLPRKSESQPKCANQAKTLATGNVKASAQRRLYTHHPRRRRRLRVLYRTFDHSMNFGRERS
jgi:hypothetical protein